LKNKLLTKRPKERAHVFVDKTLIYFGKNREKEKVNSVLGIGIMFLPKKIKVLAKRIFPQKKVFTKAFFSFSFDLK
jgi:hypothetical protein